ncbi:MAG: tetratricopeptide repeat protein [Ignavibacteria bacterium]|nr:tetratricopeptide repeat protein [Ignavibacteria bacterium]
MENSLSEGLISGLRNVTTKNKDYIQITAGISPGSSGGAVVNSKGELIGISTSSLEGGQNLNFAIPSGEILKISTGTFSSKKYIEANNYFYKGYNADENGNYQDAIDYFTKFINLFPDKKEGYYNRGTIYFNLKEYSKAISDYNSAIEINPVDAEAYNNRGIVYKNQKEYNKAISDYNKAIEINPEYADAYNNRGIVYKNLKEYNKAISVTTKLLRLILNTLMRILTEELLISI